MLGGRSLREESPSGSHRADGCIPLQGREQRRAVGDCRAGRARRQSPASPSWRSARRGPRAAQGGLPRHPYNHGPVLLAVEVNRTTSTVPSKRLRQSGRRRLRAKDSVRLDDRQRGKRELIILCGPEQSHRCGRPIWVPREPEGDSRADVQRDPGWVKASRQQQRAALEDLFLFIELLQQREKSALGNLIGRS